MHKYSLAVFDMAGTTIDEDNIVYKTLRKVLVEAGYDTDLQTVLVYGAGKEKYEAIADILTEKGIRDNSEIARSVFEDFRKELKLAYAGMEISPFDGVVSAFSFLKSEGMKVVLNTGYDRKTATGLLEKLNWREGRDFDLLVTAGDVDKNRPYPDMIFLAMQKFGIKDASEVLKIGDSAIDIEEGKNAGCGLTIGVTTGAQDETQLRTANPDFVIRSLKELREIVVAG